MVEYHAVDRGDHYKILDQDGDLTYIIERKRSWPYDWEVRDVDGNRVDQDKYRNDLFERFNITSIGYQDE